MVKIWFCAAAMLIGALIGANAPPEWRGDTSRVAHVTDAFQASSMARADYPRQR